MPIYNVIVTHDTTMSVIMQVEADSASEAEDIALGQARDPNIQWEHDDGNAIEPYVCGSPELAETAA